MLTYARRNSDCHAKNIALLYTQRADAQLCPAYGMITTTVYAGYQHNPPAISFMGRKTWTPGKTLPQFVAETFGITHKLQTGIVESISDAVSDTAPEVRMAMARYENFEDLGARMLLEWNTGVNGLREKRLYSLPTWKPGPAFAGFSEPSKLDNPTRIIGRSEGLAIPKPRKKLKKR